MGQCFSFVLRPGRRKVQFESPQKSSTEGKSTSATSRSAPLSARRSTRRSSQRWNNAKEECEAEAASGFFSTSDTSKASENCASPANGAPAGKEHQTFRRLIAQEAMSDAMRKSTDRQMWASRDSPEKPPPVPSSKASADGGRKNSSPDLTSTEITRGPSVADSLNIKGKRSLERLKVLPPENPKRLKKSRSRNGSFGRSTGTYLNSAVYARESKQSLSGPVDFDFLVQKAAADISIYPSIYPSKAPRDGEPSAPIDLNGPDSTGTSPLVAKDTNDFSRSYRESAAKAAARDRDAFKYISSSENDVSITSFVGASPAGKARRKCHSRSSSSYNVPDVRVSGSPTRSGTMMKHAADFKQKAASSPLPRPVGLTRNESSPSFPEGTPPVEAKAFGLTRNRSSPGSLHPAGMTAAEAQAQARQKYAHVQLVSKAGKLSSSAQSRRAGNTISDDNPRNVRF